MSRKPEATFGLVHGSWHGAWCWSLLQDELDNLGYRSVAMDLPVDDPSKNFDDYAKTVTRALEAERNIILVGHSRGGNIIPRAAHYLAAQKMIFLASSFEHATIKHPTDDEKPDMPPRNIGGLRNSYIEIGNEMTVLVPEKARDLFYSDCPADIQEWALGKLRPQRRSRNEPALASWPSLPQAYIYCTEDQVINPHWSLYAARNWLGVEPVPFPGNHSPFLSHPAELASTLASMAVSYADVVPKQRTIQPIHI